MNIFDLDGVITIGIMPTRNDLIITGRSIDEKPETEKFLKRLGLDNQVFYNPIPYDKKTRESSAIFKVEKIKELRQSGFNLDVIFEDDPIQADVIESLVDIDIVRIIHNLSEKENCRHYED